MRVALLDGFDKRDAPAELLWRKHLALLVYLARSPRGRTRDHLVGLLWPDKDDAKAKHSLNEALRVLRRSLGDALETTADTVTLAEGAVMADVDALPALPLESLGRVFLEGFSLPDAPEFENWVVAERLRLRAEQLAALTACSERALARGDTAEARAAAEGALAVDGHHDGATRQLMRMHALDGARGLALEVYDRFTDRLDKDLGIAADPETARLAERIRQGRIVRTAPAAAAPRPPLVGDAQSLLEETVRVWGDVVRGEARVIVIYGDPGSGKTRLLEELSARARLDGGTVVYGLGEWENAGRPTLVVVDPAGDAGPDLAAGVSRQRGVCLAIAAARSHKFDLVAERVGRDQGAVLRTESLGDFDVAQLVRWAFPDYSVDNVDRLTRRIMADTAGIPFLVSELVLALRDGLKLPRASRAWPDAERTLDQTMPADLPESIAAALRVRYRSLSEPARRALAAVAVLGDAATPDALARGAEMDRGALDAALDEAEWARWLVPSTKGYAVTTRLARDMILQDMVTGGQQRRIRERAG